MVDSKNSQETDQPQESQAVRDLVEGLTQRLDAKLEPMFEQFAARKCKTQSDSESESEKETPVKKRRTESDAVRDCDVLIVQENNDGFDLEACEKLLL